MEQLEGRVLLAASDGLVAHWTFDETSGSIAVDTSPYGVDNSGSLAGNPLWDDAGGVFGGAICLDGSGDYITVANSNDINIGIFDERTVSMWFKVDDKSVASHKQVIFEEGGGTRGLNMYVYQDRLYVGGWNRSESNWDGDWISTDAIESDTWYHVALVLDGADTVQSGAFTVYLDGSVIGVADGSQLWSHSGDIRLGSSGNSLYHNGASGDGELAGMLDDARLYNRALSAVEIDELANTAPVTSLSVVAIDEDTPLNGILPATDREGDALTYALISGAAHGAVTAFDPDTGAFTYEADPNYHGPDSFTFAASDGLYTSNVATVSITVNSVNDAPTAADSAFAVDEDGALIGMLNGADVDTGDTLIWAIVEEPAHGEITAFSADTGEFLYEPDANYHGPESFTVRVGDGVADSNTATISITVNAVNDAPTAADGAFIVDEDASHDGALNGADVDAGDTFTWTIITGPSHGVLTSFDPTTGAFSYEVDPDYNGADSFTFVVFDGFDTSNVAAVSITVEPVNDAPTASGVVFTIDEDFIIVSPLIGDDVDTGDVLVWTIIDAPSHGVITAFSPDTGMFVYEPEANYHGCDSFTVRANDGVVDSNAATISIALRPVNDLPVGADLAIDVGQNRSVASLLNGTDAETPESLQFRLVDAPLHGVLLAFDSVTGEFLYEPEADYSGPDSFTFAVEDGTEESVPATVTLSVTPGPTVEDGVLSLDEDTSFAGAIVVTDPGEGGELTYILVDGPTHGRLAGFDPATGAFTYEGDADYHGEDSFTVRVDNGQSLSRLATVSITVLSVNDAPVNTIPPDQRTWGACRLSEEDGNPMAVDDIDLDGGVLRITLFVSAGSITLGGLDGLLFSCGDGRSDAFMTFTGSLIAVNSALDGLTIEPTAVVVTVTLVSEDFNADGEPAGGRDVDMVVVRTLMSQPTSPLPALFDGPAAIVTVGEPAEAAKPSVATAPADIDAEFFGRTFATAAVATPTIDSLALAADAHGVRAVGDGSARAVSIRSVAGSVAGRSRQGRSEPTATGAQPEAVHAGVVSVRQVRAIFQWRIIAALMILEAVFARRSVVAWWRRRINARRCR